MKRIDVELFTAIEAKAVDKVRQCLKEGANPNAWDKRDKYENTPLHYAKNAEVVRLLLKAGADPKARDKDGCTPLHNASTAGSVRLLLDAGADPMAKNHDGQTPLHKYFGKETGVVRLLLAAGADPMVKDENGRTPLHKHLWFYAKPMKLLLAAGADPNAKDNRGWTPLHWVNSCAISVQSMLAAGVDIKMVKKAQSARGFWNFKILSAEMSLVLACKNLKDEKNRLPSHTPTWVYAPMRLLLAAGADPNAKDNEGKTSLHYINEASTLNNHGAVRLLLKAGADPNAKDQDEHTPLHEAWDAKVIKLLLAAGADPYAEDKEDCTAIDGNNQLGKIWERSTGGIPV